MASGLDGGGAIIPGIVAAEADVGGWAAGIFGVCVSWVAAAEGVGAGSAAGFGKGLAAVAGAAGVPVEPDVCNSFIFCSSACRAFICASVSWADTREGRKTATATQANRKRREICIVVFKRKSPLMQQLSRWLPAQTGAFARFYLLPNQFPTSGAIFERSMVRARSNSEIQFRQYSKRQLMLRRSHPRSRQAGV